MPDYSASQAALQADGFNLTAYLSVYVGELVLEAEIDVSWVSLLTPAFNLTIVDPPISGSASNVKPGFRVMLYTSGGDFKGETRIRYGNSGGITSINLPIRENSRGYIDVTAGDIVRVYADVRLSDKLVTSTAAFAPDDLAYSDQGSNPGPTPNSGGAWAGWDWMLPIPLTGSTSFWNDPDSNGPLSHLWTYPTGLTGSSTTAADPDITAADAGEYLPTHVVTDDDNSKTTTQYVPIMVHDAANPPHDCVFESPEWNEESGGSVRVRVFENAALADIPDGAFVILWSEPNDAAIGLKSDGRSHIILTGYIRREQGDFDGDSGVETLTFEIISPMARLDELVGYSKVMLNDATPNAWSEIKTLTTKRAIVQLAQFYSNLMEAGFDLAFDANYRNEVYPAFFLQEQTPVAQIREIADGTSARFVCLRDGSFEVHMQPNLVAIGDRSGEVVTLTLSPAEIIDWQYTREHWRPVKLLELRGFSPGNSPQPIFSRWPGLAPGVGNESLTVERIIATSSSNAQIWLNGEAGRRGGAADGIYVDDDGVLQMALDLELTLPGSYWGVLEHYSEYIAINLVTTLRGLDLNDQLFVMRSKSFDYDAETGTGTVRVTLRTATNGGGGQQYVPPTESDNGLPDFELPDDIFDPLPVNPPPLFSPEQTTLGIGVNRVLAFGANGPYAARSISTDGFVTIGASMWEDISSGLSGNVCMAHVDPWDFGLFYVATYSGLYKGRPGDTPFAGWTQVDSSLDIWGNASAICGDVRMSINRQNWIALVSGSTIAVCDNITAATPTWVKFEATGGAASYTTGMDGMSASVYPNMHNSGVLWMATGGFPTFTLYKIANWGLSGSPSLINSFGGTKGSDAISPYKRFNGALNIGNAAENLVFATGVEGSGQDGMWISPDAFAVTSAEIIGHVYNRRLAVGFNSRRALIVSDEDSNRIYTGIGIGGSGEYTAIVYTDNAGLGTSATWSVSSAAIYTPSYIAYGITLNPANPLYAMLYCAGVGGAYSNWNVGSPSSGLTATKDMSTWVDLQTGTNLATILTSVRVSYAQAY